MKCAILGCGNTAKFFKGGCDSFGVNDAWKFFKTDCLVVVDPKRNFRKEERLDFIEQCNPKKFYYFYRWLEWSKIPNGEMYHATAWNGNYKEGKIYYSNNTPFVAVSLAITLGYDEIYIYGVDFYKHKNFNPQGSHSAKRYFAKAMKDFKELKHISGIEMYAGHGSSAMAEIMKVKRI